MSADNPIRNVSDTALWVAIYRAMESERSDALFVDPYARRLGGARGEAIVRALPRGASMSWAVVVRSAVMDEIVMRCVQEGATTVLNLAAGLDARPYRLALPPSVRWLHVDLPDMVEYFREHMAGETARCKLELIAADLREPAARREVFARAAGTGPVLVITEGLLLYLEAGQVANLARELRDIAGMRWWLTDLATPKLLKLLEKHWAPTLRDGNAPMQFGPAESTAFFTPYGWREAEFRSTWDESLRLKRTLQGAWMWQLLSLLQSKRQQEEGRRMSGVALLEATAPPSTKPELG